MEVKEAEEGIFNAAFVHHHREQLTFSTEIVSKREQRAARYAAYAIPDPDFDKYKDRQNLFATTEGLSISAMREIFFQLPIWRAENVGIRYRQITARDDTELDLRVYKDITVRCQQLFRWTTIGTAERMPIKLGIDRTA
ncbi:hypothetical protein BJX63DRAFT_435698 [Aspergillus granulosus]|uniref:Uncharacterized protein n=1 Tax=Aspergillus granulosus TaxID=176169 RepID=A0ABR4H0C5_9EURO